MTINEIYLILRSFLYPVPGGRKIYYIIRRAIGREVSSAFNRDELRQRIVFSMIDHFGVTSFIETGTSAGNTTEFVALSRKDLIVHSIEVDRLRYAASRRRLKDLHNVTLHQGDSGALLPRIISMSDIGNLPLCYLDAHWFDYWPLNDEVLAVSRASNRCIMLIDDFQVPEKPWFNFDTGGGASGDNRRCNLDLILPQLVKGKKYHFLFPSYAPVPPAKFITGYVMIFQNVEENAYQHFKNVLDCTVYLKEYVPGVGYID